MTDFNEFDPLKAKQTVDTEVAILAVKREIQNILDSYVGWYDPFCELIQNALDAIDEKRSEGDEDYKPELHITINLQDNYIIVSDNGVGLSKEKYKGFLAPNLSFKSSGISRGYKGVGATYIAYGFNFIQVCTRTDGFEACGRMVDARKWLNDKSPAGNPKVVPDKDGPMDEKFVEFKSGVSVGLKLDSSTHPKELSWINAKKPDQWLKILSIKTGLGAFFKNEGVDTTINVIDMKGVKEEISVPETYYCWPHTLVRIAKPYFDLKQKEAALYEKKGRGFKMPASMQNLDAIFEFLDSKQIVNNLSIDEFEKEIIEKYKPVTYFCYVYSAKLWATFNENLNIRKGHQIFTPGVQIAANNMPQGEMFQIPLRRNIGRQNQMHVLIHFENCIADLGRKGFQKDIVEFSKSISGKFIGQLIQKIRYTLRPVTGVRDDLVRESQIDGWKEEMEKHENENPLQLINDHFFIPLNKVSITSIPTREQDVIALFNQIIAGGIIRGIRIMSTNERFTYDGMYRVVFEEPEKNHLYDKEMNPLGVAPEYLDSEEKKNFISKPKILEYKYSLNGLIEDIESGEKNSNDIGLVVVWETGDDYEGNYLITSLLDDDNLSERQYHGVTHTITNINTSQKEMDMIVIKELIDYLNNPEETIKLQKEKYED